MSSEKLTVPEKLLLAALEARKRAATFTAEDLVVEAWKKFPDTFGLSGYADKFPDSNRVLTSIMGGKGMRAKSWLRKVGEKKDQLTSAALTEGETLLSEMARPDSKKREARVLRAELDRQASFALARLVSVSAARKAFAKESDSVTFSEACGFWDITVRSNASTLNVRLAEVDVLLNHALEALSKDSSSEGLKVGGVTVTLYQIEALVGLHHDMQKRFKMELDIIRKRTDERGEKKTRPF